MERYKLLKLTLRITGLGSLMVAPFITNSCGKPNPNPDPEKSDIEKCDYIVVAQIENTNYVINEQKFYIGHGIKGYIQGKWYLSNFTKLFTCSISGNSLFFGSNVYIPKYIDVNGTIYTLTEFADGGELTDKVVLPDSIVKIGDYAFSGCTWMTSLIYENIWTSIGVGAFQWCRDLTSIVIPDSVNSIGAYAFQGCGLTSITIPSGISSIERCTFEECESLVSISMPNSVNSIGAEAFINCTSLASITIPDSVNSIGEYAFHGCGLTSITIPSGISSIERCTFEECESLVSISMPNSVNSIGTEAFKNCSSLAQITLYCNSFIPYTTELLYKTPFTQGDRNNKHIFVYSSLLTTYTDDPTWSLNIGNSYKYSVFTPIL